MLSRSRLLFGSLGLLSLLTTAACAPEPRAVRLGQDECAHCRMQVATAEYAAELVTAKGRQYVFDDVICMAGFLREQPATAGTGPQVFVADFNQPAHWLAVARASFVRSPALQTPMHGQTAAFASAAEAQTAAQKLTPPGEQLTWSSLQPHLAR